MKKIMQFLQNYFSSLGVAALSTILIAHFLDSDFQVRLLICCALALIPINILSIVLFSSRQLSKKELWINRLILFIFSFFIFTPLYLLVGVIKMNEHTIWAICLSFGSAFLFLGIYFTLTDLIQKRYLKKINEKLLENNTTTPAN